ncbi:MAG: proline racemase family protein, partial [Desulfonatronovibrio sp.]
KDIMIPRNIQSAFDNCYPSGITTIDSHTAGEYTRLVLDGTGPIPGTTMADKREHFITSLDYQRKLLTREPRGNRDVVVAVVTEPVTESASFGLIYMDACRYPYLCGHATIGAVTTLLETGLITPRINESGVALVTVDTPSGPMPTRAGIKDNRVAWVSFVSVPCFVFAQDIVLDIPGSGQINIDLVCAGGFFAMVNLDQPFFLNRQLTRRQFIDLGMAITDSACRDLKVCHPARPEVTSIDVTEFYRHVLPAEGNSLVVYGEAHLDRSPCGTGTAAKMALLHHKGLAKPQTGYTNKGPLGTRFNAKIVRETMVENYPAVSVEITGNAHVTGLHHFILDKNDPFQQGFLLI